MGKSRYLGHYFDIAVFTASILTTIGIYFVIVFDYNKLSNIKSIFDIPMTHIIILSYIGAIWAIAATIYLKRNIETISSLRSVLIILIGILFTVTTHIFSSFHIFAPHADEISRIIFTTTLDVFCIMFYGIFVAFLYIEHKHFIKKSNE